MWFKQHKWKFIVPLLVVAVLVFAFWYGGEAPGMQGWTVEQETSTPTQTSMVADDPAASLTLDEPENPTASVTPDEPENPQTSDTEEEREESSAEPTVEPNKEKTGIESRPGGAEGGMRVDEKIASAKELEDNSSTKAEEESKRYSTLQGMKINPETGKDEFATDPVPDGKPVPVEPENVVISDTAYTCTLSVRCDTISNHLDWLDAEKAELVPKDSVIFPATAVTFYEGESVFNVLQREMKKAKIHMEFEHTPIYNSAYIEGINNLYEFDCGDLSGWMYKVNDWFPNYGCSRYALKDGDSVEWVYTCELGADVGELPAIGG